MGVFRVHLILSMAFMVLSIHESEGAIPRMLYAKIDFINRNGPYVGVVIPNSYEMNPLLQSPSFIPSETIPYIDFSGRRFRFGTIEEKKVVLVMTGLAMINAGITTQLLLSLFEVEGVVHYGIAGNTDPSLNLGDAAIPQYWAHTALWNWQKYGDGPDDELGFEANGDYTREIGHLNFSDYITAVDSKVSSYGSLLNSVWYQPEEVFPVDGTPESREHVFWVPVDSHYYAISKKLEGLKLRNCIDSTTCLSKSPKVVTVRRGTSASIFLSNNAYRSFVYDNFEAGPLDMETASVALVCLQQRVPFIAIKAISGGVTAQMNESATFASVVIENSVTVVVEFIKKLRSWPRNQFPL